MDKITPIEGVTGIGQTCHMGAPGAGLVPLLHDYYIILFIHMSEF